MPPSGGQPSGGGGQAATDNHMGPIWIILGIFIVGYIVWSYAKGAIVTGFFYLKLGEIDFMSLFTSGLEATRTSIHQLLLNPSAVPFSQMAAIGTQVGHYLLFIAIPILVLLSVLLYFRSSTANYRRKYDMNGLLKAESKLYPQVTPVVGKDLVGDDIEKGEWAMAMTPMQFAKAHKLLKEIAPVIDENKLKRKEHITVSVIKDKAAQTFAMQLGPLWQGFDRLNAHTKALFAAFIARASGDEKGSRNLLLSIAASSASGKLDFSGANELIEKYKNNKAANEIIRRHSYVATVMASLLDFARTDGVLASADFLWLKPVDRRLWFTLNTVGRQTAPAEISGIFAHWLAEKELGRAIKTGMIQEAVVGLEAAVANMIYHRDEKEE